MTVIYKLTNQNLQTHDGFQWVPGNWKKTSGGGDLCGPGWLHGYCDPLVAIFMNPIHANISNPILWQGEGCGKFLDDRGLKCGFTEMRIIKKIKPYKFTPEKLVEIAIVCAIESGYNDEDFISWACHWMDGSDRSAEAAAEARAAAQAWAAWSAWAAQAAEAAEAAAWAAAWSARAAAEARAAARAWAAEAAAANFDLSKILHELCD
jgi:hypothetical protein